LRQAFTLVELILTIVILSFVSYIASDLIARSFINYNRVNTLNKANLKVEIALNNISNRLSSAISETIVKRRSSTNSAIESITNAPLDYEVLEWVSYGVDSFEANDQIGGAINYIPSYKPAWSGFCNINKSSANEIVTPGSDLSFASTIINRLSVNKINRLKNSAIFFPGNYSFRNIGYSNTLGGSFGIAIVNDFDVSNPNEPKLKLKNSHNWAKRVTEHYKLAWSAYAIVPDNCQGAEPNRVCNLYLRYNYRPWQNEQYNSPTTPSSLLATNVTVFKTYATQNRIHIKLCIKEQIGLGASDTTSICKEKVVFK